jgi:hypothetical protein
MKGERLAYDPFEGLTPYRFVAIAASSLAIKQFDEFKSAVMLKPVYCFL